ncbi:phosphoenolpyruvate carboxykinase [ATP] [Saprolegnia diclina VS20]|uniref:phosphoenolpyruvate carboxykinase (ATP) n=1 Tax=Saprolegnia diclina (strain VS20) TaxID=1156394 RepID=T0RZZ7_SAPDV|nr:phosphoenolpyruvate carboxykinase [ATP] [Saprolegnia diclina VS20]EQC38163.1 phosphoenolpyruvate carboxykinase [ATP] [Saprolegnia diclina VS20]|eukprot:XP_008608490.1 phosphoenolpyruvate carboxykinase [ATP] [Saprolegnia diclina VS20]
MMSVLRRAATVAAKQQPYAGTWVRAMSSLPSLETVGLKTTGQVFRNLSYAEIAEHELKNGEGVFVKNGTFKVDTGKFTGRSPKDKYFVEQAPSKDNIWWGSINQPMKPEVFDELHDVVKQHYNAAEKVYVFDGYCGANPNSRKRVRIITELAWQHHFVTNMFIRATTKEEVENFEPDFTIINACKVTDTEYKKHGLNSEVFVGFNIEKNVAIIGGTWYGGEMKKGIFSMMNYWLPLEKIMAMHCSANKGKNGDTALFFGLSGTGKTTLSADPQRYLIGDDEHGWDDEGIFNFEGGCYAKTINLSEENEPDIYRAIKRDAMLENVWITENNEPDYYNTSKTENGRVSYPIHHIDNHEPTSSGGHPNNIIFLTCDAYGVLPPVSKLTPGQAQYHFLSGYTAKVAGTERGVTEPTATFSACFGAAFLPLHPTKYADLLQEKIQTHKSDVYLVNTGWTAGGYGVGKRMSIKDTRACIDAILDGSIKKSEFSTDPIFGLATPKTLGAISPSILNPRDAWEDKAAYDATANKLAGMFKANFQKYISKEHTDYSKFGPLV